MFVGVNGEVTVTNINSLATWMIEHPDEESSGSTAAPETSTSPVHSDSMSSEPGSPAVVPHTRRFVVPHTRRFVVYIAMP